LHVRSSRSNEMSKSNIKIYYYSTQTMNK